MYYWHYQYPADRRQLAMRLGWFRVSSSLHPYFYRSIQLTLLVVKFHCRLSLCHVMFLALTRALVQRGGIEPRFDTNLFGPSHHFFGRIRARPRTTISRGSPYCTVITNVGWGGRGGGGQPSFFKIRMWLSSPHCAAWLLENLMRSQQTNAGRVCRQIHHHASSARWTVGCWDCSVHGR